MDIGGFSIVGLILVFGLIVVAVVAVVAVVMLVSGGDKSDDDEASRL